MVRIGGGWCSLKDFCQKYESEELKKMNFVVLDGGSLSASRSGTPKGKMSGTLTPKHSSTNITSNLKDKKF